MANQSFQADAPGWAAALVTLALVTGCASLQPPPGITPVAPFDVQRYQGRWFEVARMDHFFERGLSDVSAAYAARPDGSVQVVNRGYDPSAGQWREAQGKARFTGASDTGSLKVSFFGPFYGAYHVAALDRDYRWSLVVGPDLGYCWVLARDRQLDPTQRDAVLRQATALGIDTSALIWVSQQRQDPRY